MESTAAGGKTTSRAKSFWRGVGRRLHRTYAPVGGFPFLHSFKLQFWRFGLAQGTPGAVWLTALALQTQGQLRAGIFYLAAIKVLVTGFGASALVNRFFPIHVSEWGIRGRSLWGLAHEIAWDDITEVKHLRWLIFTRYLRVHTRRKKDLIWVPLFLQDMTGFETALRELAPPDNPLRRWFDEP